MAYYPHPKPLAELSRHQILDLQERLNSLRAPIPYLPLWGPIRSLNLSWLLLPSARWIWTGVTPPPTRRWRTPCDSSVALETPVRPVETAKGLSVGLALS